MDKKLLAAEMARATGLTHKDCLTAVNAAMAAITAALRQGEPVTLAGFGTFQTVTRSPRTARNLNTGEPIALKSKKIAAFRPAPALNAAVEEPNET